VRATQEELVQRRDLVVAIDGPSGSGKSTVARGVATALELRYLDTGAMYRALTWLVLRDGVQLTDTAGIAILAGRATLTMATDPAAPRVVIDQVDVTEAVRGADVTAAVSAVSAVPDVRRLMVERQREIIGAGGIVVEGRDIGTTVVPAAPVKVFLTADATTRAQRRARQDGTGHETAQVADTEADLARRDAADSSRAASPLQQAPDAIVVDSSSMALEQVLQAVLDAARSVVAT
jgi:cytidylate kinase